jgi:hypothetical protein
MIRLSPTLAVAALLTFGLSTAAHAHEAGQQMADAAKWFLSSLKPEQKAKATFEFNNEERENWHFIPRERKGLQIKEMSHEQRLLAYALLSSGLSEHGMMKAQTIMSLEEILYQIESEANPAKREETRVKRDPERYFFSVFGEPDVKGTWGWRVEGHHLSQNFTIKDGQLLRATPSFFGTNPGEVRTGPRAGTRVLGKEEELGRTLAKSLNEEQWKKAFVDTVAPKEMITAAEHHVKPLSPEGISDEDLTAPQKEMLASIIKEYLFRLRPEIAEEHYKTIQASGPVHFAWAGEKERGQPHYYRVQGKTFLLEYDNTQNDANHVHSVWRDFTHDFGADLLGAHVEAAHSK